MLDVESVIYTICDTRFAVEQTYILHRLIGEQYRYVLAGAADPDVATYKPRIIDAELYKDEQEQWQHWHAEQTDAEQYLLGRDNQH